MSTARHERIRPQRRRVVERPWSRTCAAASLAVVETREHIEVVRAGREQCFDTIVDFERYPEWFSRIQVTEVLEARPEEAVWTVRFSLDAVLATIGYTLSYRGRRPDVLEWKRVDGDLADIEGRYDFTELEPGLTEARCRQAIDAGLWVPGPVRRIFESSALQESVREFKIAAEGQAGAMP